MRKKNKLIFGVGTNDADYEVYKYVDNKIVWVCPVYKDWKDMLRRVYCKNYQQKYQTYKNVSVCAEWLILSNFRDWVLNVQPNKNWENCVLDKDVLTFDNPKKEYSATNCCYISKMVNNFILDSRQNRDTDIRGYTVCKKTKRFVAKCANPFGVTPSERVGHIGCFLTAEEANLAWKKRKYLYACKLAELQDDPRVAKALIDRYKIVPYS